MTALGSHSLRMKVLQCVRFRSSVAYTTLEEFPSFSNLSDFAQYVDERLPTMDGSTLSKFLRRLPDGREFLNSPPMRSLVSAVVNSFASEDAATVTRLMRGVASMRGRPSLSIPLYLKNAGSAFSAWLMSNGDRLSASDFATAVRSICHLGGQDLQLRGYVENALANYIPELTLDDVRSMLRVLHDLDMGRHELSRMLQDKLSQGRDQFTNNDVIDSLRTFVAINYVVKDVLDRCIELVSQHPSLFDSAELVAAATALTQLRRFNNSWRFPILEEIQSRVRSLRVADLSRLLSVLYIHKNKQSQFADEVIGLLASSPAPKSVPCEVNMAYAICAFDLRERKPLLQSIMSNICLIEVFGRDFLLQVVEIFQFAKLAMDIGTQLPPSILTQLEEYYIQRPAEASAPYLKDLIENQLPAKYQLTVETGIRVGPFIPSLVDTKNKVVIEIRRGPPQGDLRHRVYEKLGYFSASVGLPRREVDEHVKVDRVLQALAPVMVKLGRMTLEEMEATRFQRQTS